MVSAESWVASFIERVEVGHTELTDLDRLAGDGDFGENLLAAVRRANVATLEEVPPFRALTRAFLDAGGTSGPLLGMWFRAFSRAATEPLTIDGIRNAAREGLSAVQAAAGARVGDNTMVDAMSPASDALRDAPGDLPAALGAAAAAASEGAASTAPLLGKKGRSSYVGAHAVGVIDPGALAIAWFFESALGDRE